MIDILKKLKKTGPEVGDVLVYPQGPYYYKITEIQSFKITKDFPKGALKANYAVVSEDGVSTPINNYSEGLFDMSVFEIQ